LTLDIRLTILASMARAETHDQSTARFTWRSLAGLFNEAWHREQRRRRGWLLALVVLIAAGVFIAVLRGGGGSGSDTTGGALASHQALSTPTPSVLASVVRHCDQSRPVWNGIKRPFADGPAVAAQSSGGYVALVSSARRPGLLCMTAVPGSPYVPDGGSYDPFRSVAPGRDQLTLAGGGFGGSSGAVAFDYGRVGRDVTAVEFIFRIHPAVEAVIHNGWYLAIWPEEASNMPLTASARGSQRPPDVADAGDPRPLQIVSLLGPLVLVSPMSFRVSRDPAIVSSKAPAVP
jgi:hypothetical protein